MFSTDVKQSRELISELCHNPDAFQEQFFRVVWIYLAEFVDIINELINDTDIIEKDSVNGAYELGQMINEVEVETLQYF